MLVICIIQMTGVLTLSQSVMPLLSVVSASIWFSVSSCRMAAYLNLTRASSRGERRLLCRAASKQAKLVAINFWYSSTMSGCMDMATSCTAARALAIHSSAMAIITGTVSNGRVLGGTAGDFLEMLGERVEGAGELDIEDRGLDLAREASPIFVSSGLGNSGLPIAEGSEALTGVSMPCGCRGAGA